MKQRADIYKRYEIASGYQPFLLFLGIFIYGEIELKTPKIKLGKNLTALLTADFISSFGSDMTNYAITLIIYRTTKDLLIAALFFIAVSVPKILLAPFLGKLKISASFRRIFFCGEITCACLIGVMLVCDNNVYIFIMYATYGLIFFLLECYRAEFLKTISDEDTMYRYQGLSKIINTIVTVVAPLAAGMIVTYGNSRLVFIADIVTYVAASIIILQIDGAIKPISEHGAGKKPTRKKLSGEKIKLFIGSDLILLIGGITSMLTLSYMLDILMLQEIQYSVLMSLMSLGSVVGGALVMNKKIRPLLSKITFVATVMMAFLLGTAIFVPGFFAMCAICLTSGILSSMIMVYYSIRLYMISTQEDIRETMGWFDISSQLTSIVSKPTAGIMVRFLNAAQGIAIMGAVFLLSSPLSIMISMGDKKSHHYDAAGSK